MPKIILTCAVEDGKQWETNFLTHGDLLRTYNLQAAPTYTVSGNEIAVCMETADVPSLKKALESPATLQAMGSDGVKPETLKMFVLDKEVKL